MAEFTNLITTVAGQELNAKMVAGASNIQLTKVSTSDMTYDQSALEELTEIANIKQSNQASSISVVNDTTIKIEAAFDNASITTGYYVRTLGLFANDPDEGEILYAVSISTSDNCWMPAYNGKTASSTVINLYQAVGNANSVSLNINQSVYITYSDFNTRNEQVDDAITAINNGNTQINNAISTLGDTTSQINADIDTINADLSVLDSRVDGLENLGHFVGSFDTFADVPTNTAGFTNGITINDFVNVQADETHSGAMTRYIASVINSGTGAITWTYDMTYTTDISGKTDIVSGAKSGNFATLTASGNLADSGKNASSFLTSTSTAVTNKADKVSGAVNGNFATLDAQGNIADSGKKPSEFIATTGIAYDASRLGGVVATEYTKRDDFAITYNYETTPINWINSTVRALIRSATLTVRMAPGDYVALEIPFSYSGGLMSRLIGGSASFLMQSRKYLMPLQLEGLGSTTTNNFLLYNTSSQHIDIGSTIYVTLLYTLP